MNIQARRSGFSIIELITTITISLILLSIVLPFYNKCFVRSQLGQVQRDFFRIRSAIEIYFVDHNDYPDTRRIYTNSPIPIDHVHEFTKTEKYLTPIPVSPFKGKKCAIPPFFDIKHINPKQGNYLFMSGREEMGKIYWRLPWVLTVGGPYGCAFSSSPQYWYSPTNGIDSFGGLYMDGTGTSTFNNLKY